MEKTRQILSNVNKLLYSNPSNSAHEAFQEKCALTRMRTNRDRIYVVKGTKILKTRTKRDSIAEVKRPLNM